MFFKKFNVFVSRVIKHQNLKHIFENETFTRIVVVLIFYNIVHHVFFPMISIIISLFFTHPKLLDGFNCESKEKTLEGKGTRVRSLTRIILEVEGCARALRWGPGRLTSKSITHTDLHKPNNKLVNA